ncbi:hypothetical protein LGK97_11785 [Clostridium sp. CS001]|uniref:transglutaminase domain-containing protein n=1 Tax=Clostridium sp. CS001 TaxID=2880648 RepID=UPI001CF5062D|nr:transglutaminase domain-containing protein [Clostridium sp. CS001]MCB2290448.1 hypothetical protein [Clostridium sp. CS001]
MRWIKEKLIYIVLICINFNFILILLEKGMKIKNFDYKLTGLLFLIGILIYWFYNYVLRKGAYRFFFTIGICSAGSVLYIKKAEAVNRMFHNYVVNNIIVLNDLIYKGDITYFYQYKIIVMLIIPLITTLILWITFRFAKKFILMISLAVVISLWFSSSYAVVKDYLFAYIFISLFTFIIMAYIKKIREYKDQGVKISLNFSYILIYGVAVSLIIAKLTVILPQEYKGKGFTSFNNYFNNEFASETFPDSKGKYDLSNSGYKGNEKKLGGPISINYQEVFKVKSDKPYYLKGNVNDFYDGGKWSKANENYSKTLSGKYIGNIEHGEVMNRRENTITIYPYTKFKTNTIFVPNNTFAVSGVEGTLFCDEIPTVLSGKLVLKEYNVDFYEYENLMDTIENVREFEKKSVERVLVEGEFLRTEDRVPMDYLLQPKPRILHGVASKEDRFEATKGEDIEMVKEYSEYLQVPENISDRIYDLVYEITKNSQNSIGKVLDIKNYLTKNYVYDMQVAVVPEGDEFIDYFLFKEKKGYCTYFNTAMTVMCRIAGVPARYVEGFKTPIKREERGALYSVTNADAHAWCEVLLGTSAYSNMWTVADASPTASEELQRKLEELREAQKNFVTSGEVETNKIRKPKDEKEDIELANKSDIVKSKLLSDKQINEIKILTTIILFILIRIMQVVKKQNKLFECKEIAPLYNYYLYRLATINIVKAEYQGDLEFVQGIQDSTLRATMEILVQGAYEEFYGRHSVASLNNKEYYKFLEEYLKQYQGRTGYLLNKYLGENE